jgi:RNA polymerase sigma factor (sigma-70 family)
MSAEQTSPAQSQARSTRRRTELLHQKEAELEKLIKGHKRKEFFQQTIPLLKPIKSYIKRRLRIAYLTLQIRTPVYTSGDILDDVVLSAYQEYEKKPANLSLEEWLYRLANERLGKYLAKETLKDKRRASLEALTQAELRTLEEMPITADADGEVWLPEELDDSEYDKREFYPPTHQSDPEEQLERTEELQQIVRALSHVPEPDRIIFELFVVEGFSKGAVARIMNVSPEEVPHIAERVKAQVRREIGTKGQEATDRPKSKAS